MMTRLAFVLLLGVIVLPVVLCTYGVDVSQPTSISAFQCMVNNGYSFAICFQSTGNPDPNGPQTVYNAWQAGMAHVDVYMFPCPTCGNPSSQVQAAYNYLQNSNTEFGMMWFDIEGPQYWMDQASNQAFFQGLINAAQQLGLNIGIYTSASQWEPIMGAGYTGGSAYPLWYAHYDGNPSFSDFQPFGGWTSPAIKQYNGDQTLCGAGVDLNWYP